MPAWDDPVSVVDEEADEAESDLEKPRGGVHSTYVPPNKQHDIATFALYGTFLLAVTMVLAQCSELGPSVFLTLSAGVQTFGFAILAHRVVAQRSVDGLSARSLELYALFFAFRLASTCRRSAYVPVDNSGDWAYQAFDGCSFFLVLQLLYALRSKYTATYRDDADLTLDFYVVLPVCVLFGCYFHPERDHSVLYDVIWQISFLLDALALVPQLVLMRRVSGGEALTSHFVAAVVVSRSLSFAFWALTFQELAPKDARNTVGWMIFGMQLLQLLVGAEFALSYARHVVQSAAGMGVFDDM